jgi:hypothetical protein
VCAAYENELGKGGEDGERREHRAYDPYKLKALIVCSSLPTCQIASRKLRGNIPRLSNIHPSDKGRPRTCTKKSEALKQSMKGRRHV